MSVEPLPGRLPRARLIGRHLLKKAGLIAAWFSRVCGGALTRLLAFGRDERMVSATVALRRTEAELRAVNEKLLLALRAGRAGFVDWDMSSGEKRSAPDAPEFELLFGIGDSAEGARLERWTGRIVVPDLERIQTTLRCGAAERVENLEVEFRIVGADEKERWIACQGHVTYGDTTGEPLRMIGVAIDVTARKKADAALAELNRELERRVGERTAELERLNAEKEALDCSVSHDLRKPLRAIHGFARILLDDYADKFDGEALRRLRIISTATEFMGKLIDDLLNLSCLSRRAPHADPVDVGALALSVFDSLDMRDPRRDINLTIGELPQARCDRELTRVALEQLLENAVRFTVGRQRAQIEVGGAERGGERVYWVIDNGVGFDMGKVHKLFHPFKRMHAADGFEGTGVGLALVKRAVELQGGRVWAEGKPNEGATFYFAFPSV